MEAGALLLSAMAAGAAWLSYGALAVVDGHLARVGVLPPPWTLAVISVIAVGVAAALRLRTAEAWPLAIAGTLYLPWLPAPLPSVVFMFDGPLEAAVWAVALGGVAVGRLASRPAGGLRVSRTKAPWIAGALFFACSMGTAVALHGSIPGGDEPHYLIITQSLINDGDLAIENNHQRADYAEYIAHDIPPDYLRRGKNGAIYSIHAPGISALVLPAFALAGYPGAVIVIGIVSALALVAMWRSAHQVTTSRAAAWASTLAIASSATYFCHSFTIYPEPAAAAIVAVALLALIRFERGQNEPSGGDLALTGALLSVLPWLHTRFSLIAGMFGLVMAVRLWQGRSVPVWRPLLRFAAVPIVSAAAWVSYFWIIYGTPNPTAPYGGGRQSALEWMPAGLVGLAVDQQFGLIANAPIFGLAAAGLALSWRARPRLTTELVMIALPYVLAVASFQMWWGGWSAPARFLVVVLPLSVIPLAQLWASGQAAGRCLFVALTSIGAAAVAARVVMHDGTLMYNLRDGYDLLLNALSYSTNLPLAFPSVHRLGASTSALVGGIWLAAGLVAWLLLDTVLQRRRPGLAARWTLTAGVVMVMIATAMSLSWQLTRTAPLNGAGSQLAFVQRWTPKVRTLSVLLPDVTFGDLRSVLEHISLHTLPQLRRVADEHTLLALARVPAGDYRVLIDGVADPDGALDVSIGATSQSTEHWLLRRPDEEGFARKLPLPASVHSVTIRGDQRALASIRRVTLQPERIDDSAAASEHALRATRYGPVRVFFLDDGMLMEPGGIWTRGNARADVIAIGDGGRPVDLTLRAGPVATTVTFDIGGHSQEVTLAANGETRLRLPSGRWSVVTTGVFRPRDYDPLSQDARRLGARLEF